MDQKEKICKLTVKHSNGDSLAYDFNHVSQQRNESFRNQIADFFNRIKNEDFTSNSREKEVANMVAKVCIL